MTTTPDDVRRQRLLVREALIDHQRATAAHHAQRTLIGHLAYPWAKRLPTHAGQIRDLVDQLGGIWPEGAEGNSADLLADAEALTLPPGRGGRDEPMNRHIIDGVGPLDLATDLSSLDPHQLRTELHLLTDALDSLTSQRRELLLATDDLRHDTGRAVAAHPWGQRWPHTLRRLTEQAACHWPTTSSAPGESA